MKPTPKKVLAPKKQKSLADLANQAGFYNLHDRATQVGLHLIGSLVSDNYESIYLKVLPLNNTITNLILDECQVEILGVKDPQDYASCALYRIKIGELRKHIGGYSHTGPPFPGNGGINLDKEEPIFKGSTVVNILLSYIAQEEQKAKLVEETKAH